MQLSIDVASDSEQASDEWTEWARLSRGSTKARSVRKSRRAQQTLLDVSSGHSQSTAAAAADSHSAPVSAKRSLSSALGSSSSGGSAPKRAKSSVGLAATDELKRSQAKAASLQLRCNRLEQELHSAQLRASVAEATQQQLAQTRQTLSASDQSRRRVSEQFNSEKQRNRQLQAQMNELHQSLQAALRLAVAPSASAAQRSQHRPVSSAPTSLPASTSVSGQPQRCHRPLTSQAPIVQSLISDSDAIDLCSPSPSAASSDLTELQLSPVALPAPAIIPQLSEFPFANTSQPGEFIRVASVNMHGMGRWRTGDLSSINELQRAMDTQLIDIAVCKRPGFVLMMRPSSTSTI